MAIHRDPGPIGIDAHHTARSWRTANDAELLHMPCAFVTGMRSARMPRMHAIAAGLGIRIEVHPPESPTQRRLQWL